MNHLLCNCRKIFKAPRNDEHNSHPHPNEQIATSPYDLTKPMMIFVAPRNDGRNEHSHPNKQIAQPDADRHVALRNVIARRTDKLLN